MISVIIATYNRKAFLRKALLAYNRQTFLDFEVIVTSDGSSDGSKEMVKNLQASLKFPIIFIEQEDKGFRKTLALNRGAKQARSEYLVFTDDDCVVPHRFLESHCKKAKVCDLVVGQYITIEQEKHPYFTDDKILSGHYEKVYNNYLRFKVGLKSLESKYYIARKHLLYPRLKGSNFSVSKKAFLRINGFDLAFEGWGCEDNDLRHRLYRSGVKIGDTGINGYVFHLGNEHHQTPRGNTQEQFAYNKAMAYSFDRPWRCVKGIDQL